MQLTKTSFRGIIKVGEDTDAVLVIGGEDVNYTVHDDERPFIAKSAIEIVRHTAPIALGIAAFMASHTLGIVRDPNTNKPITVTSEKCNEEAE